MAGLILPLAAPPAARADHVSTARISVRQDGSEANFSSAQPAISADGRFVAFLSFASNLVPQPTSGSGDVFLRDSLTGEVSLVSVTPTGTGGRRRSDSPSISTDGRFVAFSSFADDLVAGDMNREEDIFLRDTFLGSTTLVSLTSTGAQALGPSLAPSVSADGRFVAFNSWASNLVPGDTNGQDIFVRDNLLGTTERVSLTRGGAQANGGSFDPSISGDGSRVAFLSYASNLVAGDTNQLEDVFVRDRVAGTTVAASVAPGGAMENLNSLFAAISADGGSVAFVSNGTNLAPPDLNPFLPDVFVRDLDRGVTELVSVDSLGVQREGIALYPHISEDGAAVVFSWLGAHFGPQPVAVGWQIYLRERPTRRTVLVSATPSGQPGNNGSLQPVVASGGRFVAFDSDASDLVEGDTNGRGDVFVRDRGSPTCGAVREEGVVSIPAHDTVEPAAGPLAPVVHAGSCAVASAGSL